MLVSHALPVMLLVQVSARMATVVQSLDNTLLGQPDYVRVVPKAYSIHSGR